jgi:cytochrome c-type biogenesis protein CcmE
MKKSLIFGLAVIAIAIALIISATTESSTYGTISDAKKTNSELHIIGHLDLKKGLYYDAAKDANYFSFYMKDTTGLECKVVYTGTEPEDFERSEKIVLVGKMDGEDFHASKILLKCPSKYTPDKLNSTKAKAKSAAI